MFLILFCCCSCTLKAATGNKQLFAYLSNDSQFFLLPPDCIENSMDMAQLVSASYEGRSYFINAWVKADKTGIEMSFFNELGAGMGNLSYRDGHVFFSSPVLPKSLKPEYIVADFQLCFYNVHSLGQALEESGLYLENTENRRSIYQKKTIIIEIERIRNTVRFINHLRGYSYTLEGNNIDG